MKARLFFIASTLLLLFYACSKQEVRVPDSVVEHSIETKEIKVLYDHVAAQLSSKMQSLGYSDILPDYDNIKYHYQDASHEAAYIPIFRNAATGIYIQLTVFKKGKLLRSIVTVMKPGSGWNNEEREYSRFTGEVQFYGSNGLFVKRMQLIKGLVADGTVDDKEFINTRVVVSGSEISLAPPLLANDMAPAKVEQPSQVLTASRVASCSQCHGAMDDPCAGRWGEFGCGELTEVVVVSNPQQPPAFLPFLPDPYAPPVVPPYIGSPPPPDPCVTAANAASQINKIYNQPAFKEALAKFGDLRSLQVEYGFAFMEHVKVDPNDPSIVSTDRFYYDGIIPGEKDNITIPVTTGNLDALMGTVHTHPTIGYTAPSARDVFELYTGANVNTSRFTSGRFQGNFVFAYDGSAYAMTITDPALYNQFYTTKSTNLDGTDWNVNSEIGKAFKQASDYYEIQYKKDPNVVNKAYEEAMAAVLDQFNTGITLHKRDPSTGNFNPLKRKATTEKDKKGNPKTAYTDPCK